MSTEASVPGDWPALRELDAEVRVTFDALMEARELSGREPIRRVSADLGMLGQFVADLLHHDPPSPGAPDYYLDVFTRLSTELRRVRVAALASKDRGVIS